MPMLAHVRLFPHSTRSAGLYSSRPMGIHVTRKGGVLAVGEFFQFAVRACYQQFDSSRTSVVSGLVLQPSPVAVRGTKKPLYTYIKWLDEGNIALACHALPRQCRNDSLSLGCRLIRFPARWASRTSPQLSGDSQARDEQRQSMGCLAS